MCLSLGKSLRKMKKLIRITHEELETRLGNDIIHFYHEKVNGDIKKCLGTKCESKMPAKVLPVHDNPSGVTVYYDIMIGQYRSASKKLGIWIEK
jgi:hypothetical protein